jgi:hypothetical protein
VSDPFVPKATGYPLFERASKSRVSLKVVALALKSPTEPFSSQLSFSFVHLFWAFSILQQVRSGWFTPFALEVIAH